MARSERLLSLLQALRRRHYPVSGAILAEELDISLRTLYRDIASLRAQGADIEGEPGIGYVLHPGFLLPPLMFSQVELEALMLGIRWVNKVGDASLVQAASDVHAKISAVLPETLRAELENTSLRPGPRTIRDTETVDLELLRTAMREELKVHMTYLDERGRASERIVWPITLGYFDEMRVLVAWCELRNGFRHFRTDRMQTLAKAGEHYPRSRLVLLSRWRKIKLEGHSQSG